VAIQDTAPNADSHSRIRYRPSRVQQAPAFVFIAMCVAMGAVMGLDGALIWPMAPVAALIVAQWGYIAFRVGITLTPEVHNLRRHTIRWADIQAIQVEGYLGSRAIVIYRTDGSRVRLRAPITGFLAWDRRFDEKFHTIGRWWLDHRGAGWAPGPQTAWAPRVSPADRPRLRPAVSQAVPIVLLLAVVGCDAALGGLIAGPDAGASPTALSRIVAAAVLIAVATAIWQFGRHGGITLAPDHADVHNLRRRRLLWSDVEDVAVKRTRTGARIVVRERSGRQTRLSSPRVGLVLWDRDFADKAWAIHRCWQTGSRTAGAEDRTAEPVSSASFLQLGGHGNPRVWKTVLVILVCVALGYELFVGLIVSLLLAAFGS
jgi:hypothetical protein